MAGVIPPRIQDASDRQPPKPPKKKKKPQSVVLTPPKPPKKPPPNAVPQRDPNTGILTYDPLRTAPPPNAAKRREILRRQQLLKNSGFNVTVDGVWGPASQRAWRQYQQQHRFVDKPSVQRTNALSIDQAARQSTSTSVTLGFSNSPPQPTKAEIQAEKRRQAREAAAAAKRELAKQRADILRRAAQLKKNPQLAAKMSIRELADVLVDKEAKFNPAESKAAATALQINLIANGYKVKATGVFDKQTYSALKTAFRNEERREKQQRIRDMSAAMYGSGLLSPGQKSPLWGGGVVPTPQQLIATINKGGFAGDMALRQLMAFTASPMVAWEAVKKEKLAKIIEEVAPYSTSGMLSKIGGAQSVQTWQYYIDTLAVTDLMPYGDYARAGFTEEETLKALKDRASNKEVKERNTQAVHALRAQVKTLINSENAEDFKHDWVVMTMKLDIETRRRQQEYASKEKPWWGDALDAVIAPGDFLRTAGVYSVMEGMQTVGQTLGLTSKQEKDIVWEDAMATLGKDPGEWYDGNRMGAANPVLRFGFELFADPLNVARPFRAASSVSHLLTGGQKLGRYSVGTIKGYRGFSLGSRGLVYEKGTWSKAALSLSAVRFVDRGGWYDSEYGERMRELAGRFAKTKEQAKHVIEQRIRQGAANGFRKSKYVKESDSPVVTDASIRKLLDDSERMMGVQVGSLGHLQPVLRELLNGRVSLFVDAARGTHSQHGAAILAFLNSTARGKLSQKMAWDYGRQIYGQLVESGVAKDIAHREAQAEVDKIVKSLGSWLRGGGSATGELKALSDEVAATLKEEFPDVNTRRIAEAIESQMELIAERNRKVVLPSMQDHLERDADMYFDQAKARSAAKSGDGLAEEPVVHPLWDEEGKWVGRRGSSAEALTDSIRSTFDEMVEIRNPLHGVQRTKNAAMKAIRNEIAREIDRLDWYVARNAEAGTLNEGFDYAARVEKIEQDVHAAWDEVGGGMWTDTRETIMVSKLYLREVEALEGIAPGFKWTGDPFEFFGQNASKDFYGPMGHTGRVMKSLDDFVYMLISQPSDVDLLTAQVGKGGVTQHALDFWNALDARAYALKQAEGNIASTELWKQGLFMAAGEQANSAVVRYAFKALSAQMALWKFATLALRPGWVVRNVVDNTMKILIAGVRDPRLFFAGSGAGRGWTRSVFSAGLGELKDAVGWLDDLFGTNVLAHMETIFEEFWKLPKQVLGKVFTAHNIDVPESVFDSNFSNSIAERRQIDLTRRETERQRMERLSKIVGPDGEMFLSKPPRKALPGESAFLDFADRAGFAGEWIKDKAFYMMGEIPENYARAVLWRSEYKKQLAKALEMKMPVTGLGETTLRVTLDQEVARATMRKVLGSEADNIEVALQYIPEGEPWGYSGVFYERDGLIVVNVPANMPIRSIEEAQWVAEEGVLTFLHELRHAKQASRFSNKLDEAIDRKMGERFYKLRPSELDAEFYARVQARRGAAEGLIQLHGPSQFRSLSLSEAEIMATERAIQAVDDTLFDYSKMTVAEENFKAFFPFVQFWRKNTQFWANTVATKPWVNNALAQYTEDMQNEWHLDMPAWMRRYFHTDEIMDALAVVPGLAGAFEKLGLTDGAMIDPLSFSSFNGFYRAFKGENQFLAPEDRGHGILAPIFRAMDDYSGGLSFHPAARKVFEKMGLVDKRGWQTVFPQTSFAQAFANWTGNDEIGKLAVALERVASFGMTADPKAIADNFEFYVQQEIAGQVARGEEPNRAEAEDTIRRWMFVQQAWGYFVGMYWRRATPEDMYLAELQGEAAQHARDPEFWDSLSEKDKQALRLWSMRGMDRMVYDRYLAVLPVITAYYRAAAAEDWDTANELKKDHPEIIRWVGGSFNKRAIGENYVKNAQMYQGQQQYFLAMEMADTLDLPHDQREMVYEMFSSKKIKKFWKENGTPARIRERMIQGEVNRHLDQLSKGYFDIPDDDYEARNGYLSDHPELIRYWNRNNDPADDYEAIMGNAKASLRDQYFAMVNKSGWDGDAAEFLKDFSFMFEGTKAESKIKNGEWVGGGGSGSKWSPERLKAFREAKPHLDWFFDTFMKKVGEKEAWKWLEKSDSDGAKIIKDYLKKYAKKSQHAIDFLRAKKWLLLFWGMPKEQRYAWLKGNSEGAKIVREYFKKYASDKDLSQHARDYLDTKAELDYYFKLPKAQREEWLKGDDPRAVKVLAYFKKYGKHHQFERAYKELLKKYPALQDGTPEQRKRLAFWSIYFSLTPDKRPQYILENAEDSGVFVWGEFGEQELHDRKQEYLRRVVGQNISQRQAAYLYVKPLMDFYRNLPKTEKPLFLRANPELQEYFDKYVHKSVTGDKKLDALVERYFKLPQNSTARTNFLRKHPEVQDFFDKKNPAEGAVRDVLEQYFALDPRDRQEFLAEHPEVSAYFDRRRDERRALNDAMYAFDKADPRLRPFYENAADLERAAERMRHKLRLASMRRLMPDTIASARERQPLTT